MVEGSTKLLLDSMSDTQSEDLRITRRGCLAVREGDWEGGKEVQSPQVSVSMYEKEGDISP